MKFVALALIASVSAFNTNDFDVDIDGNVFKKVVMPKPLTSLDIKKYKQSLL